MGDLPFPIYDDDISTTMQPLLSSRKASFQADMGTPQPQIPRSIHSNRAIDPGGDTPGDDVGRVNTGGSGTDPASSITRPVMNNPPVTSVPNCYSYDSHLVGLQVRPPGQSGTAHNNLRHEQAQQDNPHREIALQWSSGEVCRLSDSGSISLPENELPRPKDATYGGLAQEPGTKKYGRDDAIPIDYTKGMSDGSVPQDETHANSLGGHIRSKTSMSPLLTSNASQQASHMGHSTRQDIQQQMAMFAHSQALQPQQLLPLPPPHASQRVHSYSPRFGLQAAQGDSHWAVHDYGVSTFGSPVISSHPGPHPSPLPLHPPQPLAEVPYYASPRPIQEHYHGPPITYVPVAPHASAQYEPVHTAVPGRVEKQSSTNSSQRQERQFRTRRRRHASRHGDSVDTRINSVALITPTHFPLMSMDTRGVDPQVSERPPGGYYWAVMAKLANSDDDDGNENDNDEGNNITLPIQMCQPPLRNVIPAYPQALQADPQPRLRKQSKYTAEQDRLILELKSNGETWADIAVKAHCHNQLAARNRYQVLIGQQGSGTFFWTEEDIAMLQNALDEAERAKWLFLAQELTRKRGRTFSLDAVHLKVTQMFSAQPEAFGVIKTRNPNRGGAPYRRKSLSQS